MYVPHNLGMCAILELCNAFQNPYNAQQSQDCRNNLRIAQCMCYNACVIDSFVLVIDDGYASEYGW